MTFILSSLLSFVLNYKYAAIFAVVFLGSIGVPIPAGPVMIAAAAFASQGYINFYGVFGASATASLLADAMVYWLARLVEDRIMSYRLFRRILSPARLAVIKVRFERHAIFTIIISRFTGVTTIAVNILTGLTQFSFRNFFLWDCVGEIVSTAIYMSVAYWFGSNWIYLVQVLEKLSLVIALGVGAVILWKVLRLISSKKNKL